MITGYVDRTVTFITKTPPVPVLIKRAVNLAKGSGAPNKNKVGKITEKQVEEIAKIKMPDLNCFTLEPAMRSVKGDRSQHGRGRGVGGECDRSVVPFSRIVPVHEESPTETAGMTAVMADRSAT